MTDIFVIPTEIVLDIFRRIDFKSILRVRLVQKQMHNFIRHYELDMLDVRELSVQTVENGGFHWKAKLAEESKLKRDWDQQATTQDDLKGFLTMVRNVNTLKIEKSNFDTDFCQLFLHPSIMATVIGQLQFKAVSLAVPIENLRELMDAFKPTVLTFIDCEYDRPIFRPELLENTKSSLWAMSCKAVADLRSVDNSMLEVMKGNSFKFTNCLTGFTADACFQALQEFTPKVHKVDWDFGIVTDVGRTKEEREEIFKQLPEQYSTMAVVNEDSGRKLEQIHITDKTNVNCSITFATEELIREIDEANKKKAVPEEEGEPGRSQN